MVNFDYDCSGWATKANTKCYDGLTIAEDAFKPTANIDVIVALIKKEEPVNTPATRDKLGLVKIGDGMNVTSGGSISTRAATDSEFDAMMVRVFGEG